MYFSKRLLMWCLQLPAGGGQFREELIVRQVGWGLPARVFLGLDQLSTVTRPLLFTCRAPQVTAFLVHRSRLGRGTAVLGIC